MGLNRYKYLVRTYATLYYLGADRVPGAARHTGSCARAASLSPGSVTAGSWHSVAGYLAVLPIASSLVIFGNLERPATPV